MLSKEFNGIVIYFAETDAEWSASVMAKNGGRCVLCERPGTPAHIISRRHLKTRLIIENGVPLCVRCHNWYDSLNIYKMENVAMLLIGSELYRLLQEVSRYEEEINIWE